MDVLQIKSMTKSYPVANEVQDIFHSLTLEIPLTGITVLLGKSGSGKTTLLRLVAGLEQPQQGTLTFLQNGAEWKPSIGMVFQESRLLPWLTVEENIMLSQETWTMEEIETLLDAVGLDRSYRTGKPDALSGGMAQRVALARALAYHPDLLLMDEPFSALDYFTRRASQDKLIEIEQRTGTAILFVTHNPEEAIRIANRILVLEKGKQPASFEVNRPYPRDPADADLVRLRDEILRTLQAEA